MFLFPIIIHRNTDSQVVEVLVEEVLGTREENIWFRVGRRETYSDRTPGGMGGLI